MLESGRRAAAGAVISGTLEEEEYSEALEHWDLEEMVVGGRLCWTPQLIAYDEEHDKQFQWPLP